MPAGNYGTWRDHAVPMLITGAVTAHRAYPACIKLLLGNQCK